LIEKAGNLHTGKRLPTKVTNATHRFVVAGLFEQLDAEIAVHRGGHPTQVCDRASKDKDINPASGGGNVTLRHHLHTLVI
jgi:hypothetical protein